MLGTADPARVTEANITQATYAGAKRRIAALEQQVLNLQEAGSQRKKQTISNVTQGRVIARLVSLFEPVEDLVDESDRRRVLDTSFNDDNEEGSTCPIEHSIGQRRTYHGYELLVRHVSLIETKLVDMDSHDLSVYFQELRRGSSGARGDDAANLKPIVVSWVVSLFENVAPPLLPTTKSDRGFEHDTTGRLLCPIDHNWDDMIVRKNIRDGHPNFAITSDSWPAYLYPRAKGDPLHAEDGFLQSAILVKAFKFIFTSPTSAQDIGSEMDVEDQAPKPPKRSRSHKAPTRGNVANLLGLKVVTPRSIAYIAVQLRFSLSNASAWSVNDGSFNYLEFYNHILDFFDETTGPAAKARVQALLAWWSSKIFGSHIASTGNALLCSGTSVSKLAQQRAAREVIAL